MNTPTIVLLQRKEARIKAQNARIQMLLRLLAKTTQERDTYAEGLHQLKDQMFQAKMQAITTQPAQPAPELYAD